MYFKEISRQTALVEKEFGGLNTVQLNWKISDDSWSIAQCIQHIIVANGKYLPVLKNAASGKSKMTFWEKNNPLSNYTGKQMTQTLGPDIGKKYLSPKLFLPSTGNINQTIISEFKNQQTEICNLFKELESEKYSKWVVTSPVAALLTLKLSDLIKLITLHEQRHINQALKIKLSENFPDS